MSKLQMSKDEIQDFAWIENIIKDMEKFVYEFCEDIPTEMLWLVKRDMKAGGLERFWDAIENIFKEYIEERRKNEK